MNLELQLYGSYGIPLSSSTLAYDSIQRLLLNHSGSILLFTTWTHGRTGWEKRIEYLQVATTDGRIKLVGTACIERTLTSSLSTATLSLHVLPNTGCFLRLDVTGVLELWSIQKRRCMYTLDPPGISDNITACCPLIHTPFVLVGCTSGALRVVGLLNAAEELVGPSRPVEGLQWTGYEMLPEEMNVPEDSELLEIVCMHYGEFDVEVLLRHEQSTVTALSMADREVLAQATCGGEEPSSYKSEVTSICWASHLLTQILTGHQDGSIVHWRLHQGCFVNCREYFVLEDDHRDAIYNLSMVLEPSMSIIVCGGHMADAPRSVSLIHVDPVEMAGQRCPGDVRGISHIPWLGRLQGFALVRQHGSLKVADAPTGVIALTEGGYMCIHDIASGKTEPFVGDFQAHAVVCTQLVLMPRLAGSQRGFVFEQLKAHAPPASSSGAWHWALHSGALHAEGLEAGASHEQEILITGHDNGTVLLWDVSHVTPQMLSTMSCGCSGLVTSTCLQETTGLLAAGHSTGEVNVALWDPQSDRDTPATVLRAEHSGEAADAGSRKTRHDFWLHVLHIVGSEVIPGRDRSVVAMAWLVKAHPTTVWLSVAWAGGQVGVVDFSKGAQSPVWLWEQQVTVEAISSVTFMQVASKERGDDDRDLLLLVATADASFRCLNAHSGDLLTPQWNTPKEKQPLVACVALAADGTPAQASDTDGHVSWVPGPGGWQPLQTPQPPAHTSVASGSIDHEDEGPATAPNPEVQQISPRTEAAAESTVEEPEHAAVVEGGAEAHTQSGPVTEDNTAGEREVVDADDDEDWEEQLEAAANLEQAKRKNGKAGIKGFLASAKRLTAQVGSVAKDAREAAAESKHWMSRRRSQKLHSGALGTDGSASDVTPGASGELAPAPAKSNEDTKASARHTSSKHKSIASSVALLGLPSSAEWVLLVTKSTVRLYHAADAVTSARRTAEKVHLDSEIDSAAVLAAPFQQPMLVGWSVDRGLQMIRLPALDSYAAQDLKRVTGWKWNWQSDPLAKNHAKRLFAVCCATGLAAVVGPGRELLFLGLNRSRPGLLMPDAFFDPDLASAAFSAECHNAASTNTLSESPTWKQRGHHASASHAEAPPTARMSMLFKGMEKKILDAVGHAGGDDAPSGPGESSPGKASASNAPPRCCGASPALRSLFHKGYVHDGDDEYPSALAATASATASAANTLQRDTARGAHMAATQPQPRGSVVSSRPAGPSAAASPSAAPRQARARSAAEIKEAYGFAGRDRAAAAQQGVAGTAAVMSENISRLQERQERLSRLEDRTADMASDAEGFAAMAKKLAEQQRKPWWKFG